MPPFVMELETHHSIYLLLLLQIAELKSTQAPRSNLHVQQIQQGNDTMYVIRQSQTIVVLQIK